MSPSESRITSGLWTVPELWKTPMKGFPSAPWKALRPSHTDHSYDDEHGDISIELTKGTFLSSVDTRPNRWLPTPGRYRTFFP